MRSRWEERASTSSVATYGVMPVNSSVTVDVGGHESEVATTKAGHRPGDQYGDELVPVHVDTQSLRGNRTLTTRPKPQPECRAPQHPPGQGHQRQGDQRHARQVRHE